MSITSADIRYFKSENGSLGGDIDPFGEIQDGILHNLFDAVGALEALGGDVEYRCIFIKNNNAVDTLMNTKVYFNGTPDSTSRTAVAIAPGTSGLNNTEQTLANEDSAPLGISFETASAPSTAIDLGDIPPNSYRAVWVRRDVTSGAPATANATFSITVVGETS